MRVVRREATDVLTRDGETVVLIGTDVRRLSALSAEIYALTEEPLDVADLTRALEDRFGAPEGTSAEQATRDAVEELILHGILRRT